jgi:hypothetical protein
VNTLREIFDDNTQEPVEGFDRLMSFAEFEQSVKEMKEITGAIARIEGDVHIAKAMIYWLSFRMEKETKKEFYGRLVKSFQDEII